MVRGLFLLLLGALVAFAADDDWAKVKDLRTGTEIRVFKKGSSQPVLAQIDELTDDNLVVIIKKTQTAIPRDQIMRIDARPGKRPVTKETTTKEAPPVGDPAAKPDSSTSTSVSFGDKPDFETVYRRPTGAPKK